MAEDKAPAPRPFAAVAPALADYTEKVLFGDVWERPGLSKRPEPHHGGDAGGALPGQ